MARKKNVEAPATEPAPGATATETVEQQPSFNTSAPQTKKSKKPKATDITLEDLAARYIAHLDEAGKSQGTQFSYHLELTTALDDWARKRRSRRSRPRACWSASPPTA